MRAVALQPCFDPLQEISPLPEPLLGLVGDFVRELLGCHVLAPLLVPLRLTGFAHGDHEAQHVLVFHGPPSLHELAVHLIDE